MPSPSLSCSSAPRRWGAVLLLFGGLSACGGGGGGSGDTIAGLGGMASGSGPSAPPSPAGAPAASPGVAPVAFTSVALTVYDDGGCHTCVNAPGQAAWTVSHAGSVAAFFDGTRALLLDSPMAQSSATGLNDAGQVAGSILAADGLQHAARWSPVAGQAGPVEPLDLGPPAGGVAIGEAINASGQVAGTAFTPVATGAIQRAFLWTEGMGSVDLGAPPSPFGHSLARRLNDAGQVAGALWTPDLSVSHGFVWSAATGYTDVGTFGGPGSAIQGFNAAGQAAGQADVTQEATQASPAHHAFVWDRAGGLQDLGTLGGAQSAAAALNDAGDVVGQADTANGTDPRPHAFLWRGGRMQDLGTLGGTTSQATAVNASGQVVGSAADAAGRMHAFLWTAERGMVDLETLLASPNQLLAAYAISSSGAILALDTGHTLTLLRPVP